MRMAFARRCLPQLSLVVALAASAISANAQQPQPSECPAVSVGCPSTCPKANEAIKFKASISSGKFEGLTIKWSTSGGQIIDGQGTDTLIVTLAHECETVTATVEVSGLAGCILTASCSTVTDCCFMSLAQKFDEYGDVSCERERTHLASFRQQLENQPGSQGYIIVYGGRSYGHRLPRRGEREARASRITDYFSSTDWIQTEKVAVVNGGFRETWSAELWVVPAGAASPQPTPKCRRKSDHVQPRHYPQRRVQMSLAIIDLVSLGHRRLFVSAPDATALRY